MTDKLFDIVAPIAIYHRTDVTFEGAAKVAMRKAKKIDVGDWTAVGLSPPPARRDAIPDWAFQCYNTLFWRIVKEMRPNWRWAFDKWGARAIYSRSRLLFSGDDTQCFPWYAEASLLRQRIEDEL